MTNATKAMIVAAVNAAEQLVISFGVHVTDAQQAAIGGALNAGLALAVALTYKNSPKRKRDV